MATPSIIHSITMVSPTAQPLPQPLSLSPLSLYLYIRFYVCICQSSVCCDEGVVLCCVVLLICFAILLLLLLLFQPIRYLHVTRPIRLMSNIDRVRILLPLFSLPPTRLIFLGSLSFPNCPFSLSFFFIFFIRFFSCKTKEKFQY